MPPISHLLFVDDTMIFARVISNEAFAIVNVLQSYAGWFGQSLNLWKSAASFCKNVHQPLAESLALSLGTGHSAHPEKYLGLPVILPRSKRQAYLELKEKLLKRVAGWRSKL